MKARYRSKLELYMDVLSKCRNDLIHSEISRKCNISHYDTATHLQLLVSLGMIQKNTEETKGKPKYSWQITEYGLECLQKLEDAHQLFPNLQIIA